MQRKKILRLISLLLLLALGIIIVCASGCQPKIPAVIYVPHGEPARLRAALKNVPVLVKNPQGVWQPGYMDIPAGWFVLPLVVDEPTAAPPIPGKTIPQRTRPTRGSLHADKFARAH